MKTWMGFLGAGIFLMLITTPAFSQGAPVELGQGDYALDNVCAGKAGESVQKTFHDPAQAQLKIKAYCKDGQFNGVVKKYNAAGKIRVKAEYVNGQPNGTVKLHDDGGNLLFRDAYQAGQKKARYKYNDKGELVQVN